MRSLYFLLPLTHFFLPALAKSLPLTVNTQNGLIIGHKAPNRTEVNEYLGIPYAQPPINSLRFAPPEPYDPSNSSSPLMALNLVRPFPCNLSLT